VSKFWISLHSRVETYSAILSAMPTLLGYLVLFLTLDDFYSFELPPSVDTLTCYR
jgi:hypothetical protein